MCVCAMRVEVISIIQPQSTKIIKNSNYNHKDFVRFIIYLIFNFSVYAVSHAWDKLGFDPAYFSVLEVKCGD